MVKNNINKLNSNLWKYLILIATDKRNYFPILAIYFLTIPNTTVQQIGLYTGIGWLIGFLIEIPSGYISDNLGHKKALIISKISLILSSLIFIFSDSVGHFIIGSSLIAIGFSFSSGTEDAFLHNTLVALKKDKDFGQISGKLKAKASLFSFWLIILLPFSVKYSYTLPFKIHFLIDIIGLIFAMSLYSPKLKYSLRDLENGSLINNMKKFKGTGFYITSIFFGLLGGIILTISKYKEPYLSSLGFPIFFIGFVMAIARIIWYIVGHNLKILKLISLKKLIIFEIFIIFALLILASQLRNIYVVGFIFSLIIGYNNGRSPLINEYFLKHFLINKKLKATMLSIKGQFTKFFQAIIIFIVSMFMGVSFEFGFIFIGILILTLGIGIYFILNEKDIK